MKRFRTYVKDIRWERIWLTILLETQGQERFPEHFSAYLLNGKGVAETALQVSENDGRSAALVMNVSNSGVNRCIQNGTYTLLLLDEGTEQFSEPEYDGDVELLLNWGHVFHYDMTKGAYTIAFMLDEFADFARFQLVFENAYRRKMGNMIGRDDEQIQEYAYGEGDTEADIVNTQIQNRKLPLWRRYLTKARRRKYAKKLYETGRRLKRSGGRKCIVFFSQQDDDMTTNMKALYDRMIDRGLDREFDIICSLRNSVAKVQSPKGALKMVWDAAKADILILDDHAPLFNYLVIDPQTVMIQIWHAGAGFKGVGYSRWGHYGCPGPYSCHRQYTYVLSPSAKISSFFSEQFGVLDEQVIPTGMPRMDSFLNKENHKKAAEKLYEMFPQIRGKRVILFAPTYRGRNRKDAHYPYEIVDFEGLYEFCLNKDAAVLFKMHPWVSDAVPLKKEWEDRFFDLNTYPDINELFCVTDVLITDYSSSMFEYALLNKPMLSFAYDKVQYSATRGFHRSYDENVPGKICTTFPELLKALQEEDYEYEKHESYMERHFDHTDDKNCDRVIDWLILGQMPEEYASALEERKEQIAQIRNMRFAQLIGITE